MRGYGGDAGRAAARALVVLVLLAGCTGTQARSPADRRRPRRPARTSTSQLAEVELQAMAQRILHRRERAVRRHDLRAWLADLDPAEPRAAGPRAAPVREPGAAAAGDLPARRGRDDLAERVRRATLPGHRLHPVRRGGAAAARLRRGSRRHHHGRHLRPGRRPLAHRVRRRRRRPGGGRVAEQAVGPDPDRRTPHPARAGHLRRGLGGLRRPADGLDRAERPHRAPRGAADLAGPGGVLRAVQPAAAARDGHPVPGPRCDRLPGLRRPRAGRPGGWRPAW